MSAKSRKSILTNITFILNVLTENGIIFIRMGLFLKIKNVMLISKKCFFTNEAACTCVNVCKNIITS